MQLDEATGRVMYYEGSDTIRFNELTIAVTDPLVLLWASARTRAR